LPSDVTRFRPQPQDVARHLAGLQLRRAGRYLGLTMIVLLLVAVVVVRRPAVRVVAVVGCC